MIQIKPQIKLVQFSECYLPVIQLFYELIAERLMYPKYEVVFIVEMIIKSLTREPCNGADLSDPYLIYRLFRRYLNQSISKSFAERAPNKNVGSAPISFIIL